MHVIVPFPVFPSATGTRTGPNVADTATGAPSVTEHVSLPVQAPVQPTKRLPAAGSAVSAALEPWSHSVVHETVQSTPGTSLVTVPAPASATLSANSGTPRRWSHAESWMSIQLPECP